VAESEDRLPVVVAAGQSVERATRSSAMELATRAADEALAAVPGLRPKVQQVSVVNIMSKVGPAPAARLAARLGLSPARTEVTTIGGNSPQWLVNRAAAAIAAGQLEATLVAGAEAQRSARLGRASKTAGAAPPEAPGEARHAGRETYAPDPVIGDDRAGVGTAELNAGLIAPIHVYALFESAIAQRAGRTFVEHRAALGTLMARFTEVAATNPFAWFPEARAPAELSDASADNRLVSEPYTKRLCAVLNVDASQQESLRRDR
jgi:acetyl-CoA C-acetyltransferase